MFGYIKPCRPELRVKEMDTYKAVYCGLCGELGRSFGPLARLTLSYDFTFLAMLYWAVNDETPPFAMGRCYVNPLKRQPMCAGGEGLVLGADLAAIMIYYKLLDNIHDGGIFAKIGWSALRPMAAGAKKKAAVRRPAFADLAMDYIAGQTALEDGKSDCIDAACEPTALLMGGIFRLLSTNNKKQRVLERLGYLTGRFIYLCDALDDLEQDVRSGSYNPIALRYGLEKGQDWSGTRAEIAGSLYMTIGEAEKTLALLALGDFAPIINNIVSMGLRASVDEILAKKKEIKQ